MTPAVVVERRNDKPARDRYRDVIDSYEDAARTVTDALAAEKRARFWAGQGR